MKFNGFKYFKAVPSTRSAVTTIKPILRSSEQDERWRQDPKRHSLGLNHVVIEPSPIKFHSVVASVGRRMKWTKSKKSQNRIFHLSGERPSWQRADLHILDIFGDVSDLIN